MLDWLFGRHREPAPEVTAAIRERDKLFAAARAATAKAKEAMEEVDQSQQRLIDDYASADRARRRK